MTSDPVIASIGLCCPLGKDFESSSTAYGEGDRALKREEAFVASDGLAPILACVLSPQAERSYLRRLRFLLDRAYSDCLNRAGDLTHRIAQPLIMCLLLPKWMENTPHVNEFSKTFIDEPLKNIARVDFFFGEHSEGVGVLHYAFNSISRDGSAGIVVAAIDSYVDFAMLDWLACRDVLFLKNQPYGFIPGEAGVAVFIARGALAPTFCWGIVAMAYGRELEENSPGAVGLRGRGLAEALLTLAQMTPGARLARVLSDLNGERWRSEQYGFATSSVGNVFGDTLRNPECHCTAMGDLGAATSLTMLALATGPRQPDSRRQKDNPAEYPALVVSSSATGFSAVLLLTPAKRSHG
ncbi:MAG TPA: hypothetical protein VKZ53_23030 [Candidatus Angelobacter sp.]|nr:hypothetical protein [Candidatus Angelobacter sp.]